MPSIPSSPFAVAPQLVPNRAARRAAARKARRRATGAALAAGSLALSTGAMVVGSATPAGAATLTVLNTNDSGADSLRAALAAADDGDTIVFAPGVTGTINLATTLAITDGVTISGPGASVLTISGQDTVGIFDIDPVNTGQTVRISGLTLRDGKLTGFPASGGAIAFRDTSPSDADALEVSDVAFTGNTVSFDGGAIDTLEVAQVRISGSTFTDNASTIQRGGAVTVTAATDVTITGSTFTDNWSTTVGGAVYLVGVGTATVTGSTFTDNWVTDRSGGALAMYQVNDMVVDTSTFHHNVAPDHGGGVMALRVGALTVTGSMFTDNVANAADDDDGSGGGIMLYGAVTSALVEDCTFTGNSAKVGGGLALYGLYPSSLTLRGLTVTGNRVDVGTTLGAYGGGALVGSASAVEVEGSVFADNDSAEGGGGLVIFDTESVTVSTTTISGNSAESYHGGGLLLWFNGANTVRNSTISANSAGGDGGGVAILGPLTDAAAVDRVVNSTISGNVAGGEGGAILLGARYGTAGAIPETVPVVDSPPLQVIESTITANVATTTGGIFVDAGVLLGAADPAVANGSDRGGRGPIHRSGPAVGAAADPLIISNPGRVTLQGAIVSANSGLDVGADPLGIGLVDAASSILGTTGRNVTVTEGAGVLRSSDPGLEPLADNGGPTQTHALKLSSPAVDAGPDPVPTFPGSEFDQRGAGYARVVGSKVDIGAFEIQPPPPRFTG